MAFLKPLPQFSAWLDGLSDIRVRSVVIARLKRLELGLLGDVEPVGEGVSELRIQFWRWVAPVFHAARSAGDRIACWWIEAKPKTRYQTSQSFGGTLGLIGEKWND